ncbi:MAG TPA: TIGR01777 family oxidoreductase [Thermoanaerobaculia bacterium]|nr:TIGR01777 family oxidoreductase [Thermoanaerobaculia bacterium]
MKIVIPGGTGHLGRILTESFRRRGDEVVVLSRNVEASGARLWDGRTAGDWAAEIDGADVVINLAGRSVDCRYGPKEREEILRSRVDSTRAVGEAIARARQPPALWLQASTATIYAHRYDAPNDEYTGILGGHEPGVPDEWRFSIDVARAWEQALDDARTPCTRKVKMRMAMVMSATRGGPFHALLRHVRLGLGRFGDGRQYMSWIHERDFVRAVQWLIRNDIDGPVNLAAPEPLPCEQFLHELREAWGTTTLAVPVGGVALQVGAMMWRTEPELVLKSRRVMPQRLMENDFSFDFTTWHDAARDLCARWRRGVPESEVRVAAIW